MKEFTGRVKSIEFDTGKIQIANKEKDFFFARARDLDAICDIVLRDPYQYVTFELDGRIVDSFKEHSYASV